MLGTQALVLLIAALCVHIGLRRLKDDERTVPHVPPHREEVIRGVGRSLQATQGFGLIAIAVVLALPLTGVIEDEPVTKTEPTTVAMDTSKKSYDQVIEAVTDDYDVEVASKSGCDSGPAEIPNEVDAGSYGDIDEEIQEHYDRVQFLKKAVSSDFASNPQLLLKTPNGVVTCYTVQYDQADGTATLLISDEDVDAVEPGSLKKD